MVAWTGPFHHLVCLVVLACCVLSGAASAQMPGGGSRPAGIGAGKAGGPPPGALRDDARSAGPTIAELVGVRLSQLEEDLRLAPAQWPAWNAYRSAVLRMLDDQRRAIGMPAATATAPQRLDALADLARNRLTAAEEIVDAGKALYAILVAEQREVADRRLALPLATLSGLDGGADVRPRAMPGARGGETDAAAVPQK